MLTAGADLRGDRDGADPQFDAIVDTLILDLLAGREMSRLEATLGPGRTLRLLERIAYVMQSDPKQRTAITAERIQAEVTKLVRGDARPHRVDLVMHTLSYSPAILVPLSPRPADTSRFTFTHTFFREYLASAHLAQQPIGTLGEAVTRHLGDPTWEPVLRLAVGALVHRGGDDARERLVADLRRAAQRPREHCSTRWLGAPMAGAAPSGRLSRASLTSGVRQILSAGDSADYRRVRRGAAGLVSDSPWISA